jgi:hypothetical protein
MKDHVSDRLAANGLALHKEDWQNWADFASGQKLPSLSNCGIRFFVLCLLTFFLLKKG